MAENMWMLAVAGGPILLGLFLAYGIYHRRKLTRNEIEQRERVTHENYEKLKN